jgi:hypothetical protein
MPCHDLECQKCNTVICNYSASPWPASLPAHEQCGGELLILWTPTHVHDASVHPLDRVVLWENPRTGEVAYPPTNYASMPDRYRKAGYQRKEFEHARDVEHFERTHNVRNEKLWYDSGNGV